MKGGGQGKNGPRLKRIVLEVKVRFFVLAPEALVLRMTRREEEGWTYHIIFIHAWEVGGRGSREAGGMDRGSGWFFNKPHRMFGRLPEGWRLPHSTRRGGKLRFPEGRTRHALRALGQNGKYARSTLKFLPTQLEPTSSSASEERRKSPVQ
jgi:hypothetical protein